MRRTGAQRGQSAVELVAVLPALAALALAAWWLVACSAAWLQAGGAARAGARAAGVGEDPGRLVHALVARASVARTGTAPQLVEVSVPAPAPAGLRGLRLAARVPVVAP